MAKAKGGRKRRRAPQGKGDAGASAISVSQEAALLSERVIAEAPARGTQHTSAAGAAGLPFTALPLSQRTLRGLAAAKYETCTPIQQAALPHALAGRDVLGAARTGSGKTLAFVVPLLESLFRTDMPASSSMLQALVISPTRELAIQIFEVLRAVGRYHQFSAGLITGGKKEFREEQRHVVSMNVLVATPGRLLQHLEQTPTFDPSHLQYLVLDEADRILDMGFQQQLDRILSYLPTSPARQTLLFSATQAKSVRNLARLSLEEPEYLAVHEGGRRSKGGAEGFASETPENLIQNYVLCPLERKLPMLYSFIKAHLKVKTIVFFNTCAQVRFAHALFSGMQPGVPLLALHGKLKQAKRTLIYYDFLKRPAAVLFATDIASRGLDFPSVDWVVQVDAPEDSAMYIHRVGRTARYNASGRALMLVMPEEKDALLEELAEGGVAGLAALTVNPKKAVDMGRAASSVLAKRNECKLLADKAFRSYLRSLLLLPGKRQLSPRTLALESFAASMGLVTMPDTGFIQSASDLTREELRERKNGSRSLRRLKDQLKQAKAERRRKREAMEKAKREDMERRRKGASAGQAAKAADDLFTVKRRIEWTSDDEAEAPTEGLSAADRKAKRQRRIRIAGDGTSRAAAGERITFDEGGTAQTRTAKIAALSAVRDATEAELEGEELRSAQRSHREAVRERLRRNMEKDRELEKQRVKEKHRKQRMDAKGAARREEEEEEEGEGAAAVLEPAEGEMSIADLLASDGEASDGEPPAAAMDQAQVRSAEEAALELLRSRRR